LFCDGSLDQKHRNPYLSKSKALPGTAALEYKYNCIQYLAQEVTSSGGNAIDVFLCCDLGAFYDQVGTSTLMTDAQASGICCSDCAWREATRTYATESISYILYEC
jgi:hypothetical protein